MQQTHARPITLTVLPSGQIRLSFGAQHNAMLYTDWRHWFQSGITAYAEGDRLSVRVQS